MRLLGLGLFILTLIFSNYAVAGKITTTSSSLDLYKDIRKKYAKYKMVEIDLTRQTKVQALDTIRTTELKMYISSKGELRLENTEAPKSITILSDEKAMVIDEPDEFFGGPTRVLVTSSPEIKNSQAFLRVIFGQENLEEFYKVSKQEEEKLYLVAVKDGLAVKNVEISFDTKNKLIQQIDYQDAQGNEISLILKHTKFKKTSNSNLFKYDVPKGAEVTEV